MAMNDTANLSGETVIGAFDSHEEAQQAVRGLKTAGFADNQIGVVSVDHEGTYQEQMDGNKADEGATIGATTGLGVGALWGLGIIGGMLPAIGPVIAGGALAAVAASAVGTAAAGGLVGALIGMGIPEDQANYYQSEFEQGRTIVTVRAEGVAAANARQILKQYNGYDYENQSSNVRHDPREL